jgi:hypothetical protein
MLAGKPVNLDGLNVDEAEEGGCGAKLVLEVSTEPGVTAREDKGDGKLLGENTDVCWPRGDDTLGKEDNGASVGRCIVALPRERLNTDAFVGKDILELREIGPALSASQTPGILCS